MVVIIGGGPAGLTAAYRLAKEGLRSVVLEKDECVGGLARTARHKGFRFDLGGHRFFTKIPAIQTLWDEILGEDFLVRQRLSRILYRRKFFDYPLRPMNALRGLGVIESARVLVSYAHAKLHPSPKEDTFEQWVSNRFGRRLFQVFFKTYTEKVWGLPCNQISAEWAVQRIKNLSLGKAVLTALGGEKLIALVGSALGGPVAPGGQKQDEIITSLIDRFHYPRLGPGMMWECCRDLVQRMGSTVRTGLQVTRIRHGHRRVEAVETADRTARTSDHDGDAFISSMAMQDLVLALDPPAPDQVQAAARALMYRDFLIVVLIVDRPSVFPDNWLYIHEPHVRVGRIQNFKNWSPQMVPEPDKHTSLGLEYFVNEGDELWRMSDDGLVDLGRRECTRLGLIQPAEVSDGCVMRMTKAYPVYDPGYRERLTILREYVDGFENLQMVGRNGQHRYNNQDHSMMTALLAAENVLGANHNIWAVNTEPAYHELRDRAQPELVK